MAGLVPGIRVFHAGRQSRGWPGRGPATMECAPLADGSVKRLAAPALPFSSLHHINAAQGTSGNRDSNAITAESCRLVQFHQRIV